MKMILWVEDQPDHICKVLDDLSNDSIDEKLLNDYHIHRVDNLDDALTAVKNHQYDSYLLDIAFPAYDADSDVHQNEQCIIDFVENDSDENSFKQMKAGLYLFMHLLPATNIDQIRIYSGNISQTDTLEKWLSDSGIQVDLKKLIFNKDDNADKTAEHVRSWLEGIVKSPERILRHAMIEGCNEASERSLRSIYPRIGNTKINEDDLKKHIRTIEEVVKALGPTFESDEDKNHLYFSTLILLITSECQEQGAFQPRDEKKWFEFQQLMGVLDRVRNMHAHTSGGSEPNYSVCFVAFTFLVYMRSRCDFGDTLAFEKYLLALFKEKALQRCDECFDDLNRAVNERCKCLQSPSGFDVKAPPKPFFYQYLLGGKEFTRDKSYQYKTTECYRLFLLNFIGLGRFGLRAPKARLNCENGQWVWSEIEKASFPEEKKMAEFKNLWSDDYFKAFYTVAFPKKNEQ